jgi:hypothetical protein
MNSSYEQSCVCVSCKWLVIRRIRLRFNVAEKADMINIYRRILRLNRIRIDIPYNCSFCTKNMRNLEDPINKVVANVIDKCQKLTLAMHDAARLRSLNT